MAFRRYGTVTFRKKSIHLSKLKLLKDGALILEPHEQINYKKSSWNSASIQNKFDEPIIVITRTPDLLLFNKKKSREEIRKLKLNLNSVSTKSHSSKSQNIRRHLNVNTERKSAHTNLNLLPKNTGFPLMKPQKTPEDSQIKNEMEIPIRKNKSYNAINKNANRLNLTERLGKLRSIGILEEAKQDLDNLLDVKPLKGYTERKIQRQSMNKEAIFYLLKRKNEMSQCGATERINEFLKTKLKVHICLGDFCHLNPSTNSEGTEKEIYYSMSEVLLHLGRLQLFSPFIHPTLTNFSSKLAKGNDNGKEKEKDKEKDKEKEKKDAACSPKSESESPKYNSPMHFSINYTSKDGTKEISELVKRITEKATEPMKDVVIKDESLLRQEIDNVHRLIKKYRDAKTVDVCHTCQFIYENIARSVLHFLQPVVA